MAKYWPRLCRAAGALGVVLFLAAAFTPLCSNLHALMSGAAQPDRAQAIVVLGASVSPDGVLDDASLRRALTGILLERRGLAPLLLFLGPRHEGAVEADVRSALAHDLGLPAEALLTESRGLTTHDEARLSAERLQPRGIRRILLVTGEFHMWRARRLFERAGFEVRPVPSRELPAGSPAPADRLRVGQRIVVEATARLLYRLLGRV